MLNTEQIKQIIPHRNPMLLLDTIEEMIPGESATGVKTLTGKEDFFRGHFPDFPVMPGVLIIEAMAQAGAVALLSLPEFKGKIGFFAGIDEAKFKAKVLPGDTLTLKVEITRRKGPIGVGEGKAYVGEKLVAKAKLTFAIGL